MSNRAWVTLATNDSYGLGALVLANSLRRVGSVNPAVVLITPSVSQAMKNLLAATFAEVITVDVLDSGDAAHLALLQRPELGITFTKIHCWSLTQYDKCVFLDADTLVVQNCDELFDREELSASPDVGWPDCFNSGVFVFKPSLETFNRLITFAQDHGSFDGGDQGLLNSFFSDWSTSSSKRLPFLYNVTSAAFYSYLPALKHFGHDLKIIHFIGAAKPWLQHFNWTTRTVDGQEYLRDLLQLWWDIFVDEVHPRLDVSMAEVEEAPPALVPQDVYDYYMPILDPESEFPWHHPDAQMEEEQISSPQIDMTQFFDPWQNYSGNIPPKDNLVTHHEELQRVENQEQIRNYAWEYYIQHTRRSIEQNIRQPMSPQRQDFESSSQYTGQSSEQNYQREQNSASVMHIADRLGNMTFDNSTEEYNFLRNPEPLLEHSHDQFVPSQFQNEHSYSYPFEDEDHHEQIYNQNEHRQQHRYENHQDHHRHRDQHEFMQQNYHEHENYEQIHQNHHEHRQQYSHNHHQNHSYHSQNHSSHMTISEDNFVLIDLDSTNNGGYHLVVDNNQQNNREEHSEPEVSPEKCEENINRIYNVQIEYDKKNRFSKDINKTYNGMKNGISSKSESKDDEDIRPRHPYDGFYLGHGVTIDSRGRKICTHEIPATPSPSPPSDSPPPLTSETTEISVSTPSDSESHSGVAGNLARVVPGDGSQGEALDELTRRQGWEAGNIDYMGADSFDKIWAKISQTLSQPRTSPPKQSPPKEPTPPLKQSSPPKQPSPPKEEPQQESVEAPIEQAKEALSVEATPAVAVALTAEALTSAETPTTEVSVSEASAPTALAPEAPVEVAPIPEAPVPEPVVPATEADTPEVSAPVAAVLEAPLTSALDVPETEAQGPEVPALQPTTPTVAAAVPVAQVSTVEALATQTPAVETSTAPVEASAPVDAPTIDKASAESVPAKAEALADEASKESREAVPITPPTTPKSSPETSTLITESPKAESPAQVTAVSSVAELSPQAPLPSTPATEPTSFVSAEDSTPEKFLDVSASSLISTDSPPLANTPSKEETPPVPVAKCPNRACSLM